MDRRPTKAVRCLDVAPVLSQQAQKLDRTPLANQVQDRFSTFVYWVGRNALSENRAEFIDSIIAHEIYKVLVIAC
jgi:hypothetical protein